MRTRSAHPLRLAALGVLAAPLLGCPAAGVHQGTAPVPRGRTQIGAAAGGTFSYDVPQEQRALAPAVEIAVRHGVAEDVDVQVELYPIGADVGAKVRLLRGDWSMAVLPMIGAARSPETPLTTNGLYFWGHLPLIVGRRLGATTQLNFGPRVLYGGLLPAAGGAAHGLSLGGFVNVEVRASARVRFVPELAALGTASGDVPLRGVSVYLAPAIAFDL